MIPTADHVIIERDAPEEKAGRLFLPDEAKKKGLEGVVVAVGPGRWDRDGETRLPMELRVGDRVIWQRYTELGVPDGFLGDDAKGSDFLHDGKDLVVISEQNVLGVIETGGAPGTDEEE